MRRIRAEQRRRREGPLSGKRLAYTLVEMMLVLAVIGALAAVTWPSVLRMQADHELTSAAEQVRLQLAAARTRAIKSGVKYQFLYEPKGRNFAAVPLEPEPQIAQSGASGAATAASSTPSTPSAGHNSAGELPAKLTFVPPDTTAMMPPVSQKLSAAAFQGLPNAGTLASVGWSEPLVFAPDGSALDAVITVGDSRGQRIDLTVRGLTGAAATAPMRREGTR